MIGSAAIMPNACSMRHNRGETKSGPGAVGSSVLRDLTPTEEGLMAKSMPPAYDTSKWAR